MNMVYNQIGVGGGPFTMFVVKGFSIPSPWHIELNQAIKITSLIM